MNSLEGLRHYVSQLNQRGLLRTRLVTEPVDNLDTPMIAFDSNDYLSLTQDKRISEAYQEGYRLFPSGSGASMVLSGYHKNHYELERAFADFLNVDDCLLFSSGYAANLAVVALLGKIKAHCYIDKSVHASFYDGLNLAEINFTRFKHNDTHDFSRKADFSNNPAVLITEGIFSMSGQLAPLKELHTLCSKKNIDFIVDEAHSFGVIGNQGRGSVDYYGLSQKEVPLRIIPLGKAFAAQGAIVAGNKEWINALLQAGRSMIYSTALSPALTHGLYKTLEIIKNAEDRRQKLQHLITVFKECIRNSSLTWTKSNTAIQQLQLGCPYLALNYVQELKKYGISCSAIRSPTVSTKASGLRILLNYKHQSDQIHALFQILHDIKYTALKV